MCFFGALSTKQSKMPSSSPVLERKETSLQLISPKLNQPYQNGFDEVKRIVLHVLFLTLIV